MEKTLVSRFHEHQPQTAARHAAQAISANSIADGRPEAAAQRELAESMQTSPIAVAQRALANTIQHSFHQAAQRVTCSTLQRKNNTGLPGNIKLGIESLSGMSLDKGKVQATDIHAARGQEQPLPHEAWRDYQGLGREADVMGAQALQVKQSSPVGYGSSMTCPASTRIVQRRSIDQVIQRKVSLNDTINAGNLKKLSVSQGGALGVVFIPDVVAKWEVDPQEAVDTSMSINAILGGSADNNWTVGAPVARRATIAEAIAIATELHLRDTRAPGSVGDTNRVTAMVNQFNTALGNVVIYEQATGEDFIKYLAEGPAIASLAKKQSKKGVANKDSALAQVRDPGYARQLGRIAAIDIFMGHRDRLHGAGNFENWMSDVKGRSITLVDNAISNTALGAWSTDQDVQALAQGSFAALATTIANEFQSVLFHMGYGGGKLGAKDQQVWNGLRPAFETNMAAGLQAGRLLLMQRGWSLCAKLQQAHSPVGNLLQGRLGYFHDNF